MNNLLYPDSFDETRGDLLSQAIDSASGYGDQYYLRGQASLAESSPIPSVRAHAMDRVVEIVKEYGSEKFTSLLVGSEPETDLAPNV